MDPRQWSRLAALALALAGFASPALAASPRLDRAPVSEAQFEAFLLASGQKPPFATPPSSKQAAVNLNWHQAAAYCAAKGKRLPSAQEWRAACETKEMAFPWWIWEWTSTDAKGGEAGFKLLCGPGADTCGCTHAYHTTWSNEVKGFRCAKARPSVRLQIRAAD